MLAVLNQSPFMLRLASSVGVRFGRCRRAAGWAPGPGKRLSDSLRSLPRRLHLIPYGALLALGATLLCPGVVPHGTVCGGELSTIPAGEREFFIHVSAAAFALVAALLLLSALVASAQRRRGRPGVPTIAGVSLLGAIAVAAAAWPHAVVAAPAVFLMAVNLLAMLASRGAAVVVPLISAAVAWYALRGPRTVRLAQIVAWTTVLVALPLVMGATYVTVSPICFG